MVEKAEVYRLELLMNKLGVSQKCRLVVDAALERATETEGSTVALQLNDRCIVKGKTSPLLGAST
jgi:uncharacterized protein (UPF0371 family)